MVVNITATFMMGKPVYPPMDWKSVSGILTPLSTLILTMALFYLLVFLNNLKLKKSGYFRIVDILKENDRAILLEAHGNTL